MMGTTSVTNMTMTMNCKPTLYVMVGLPGSEKSREAEVISKEIGAVVLSASTIREEMGGRPESDVFDEMYARAKVLLFHERSCIIDSTNIRSSKRYRLLQQEFAEVTCHKVCVVMATPISRCFWNNLRKGNPIDPKYVWDAYKLWETPAEWEGWDEIWLHYDNLAWESMNGTPDGFIEDAMGYDLADGKFFKSLGRHCQEVCDQMTAFLKNRWIYDGDEYKVDTTRESSLVEAAMLHDCGKPNARTEEKNGKVTYYSHSNIGAYESMFYKCNPYTDKIYRSALIAYHMNPVDWNSDKKRRRLADRYRWKGNFFFDVEILHGCDVKARDVMEWDEK